MTAPTLITMPELVMNNILGFVGFQGIFVLRKVCTTLRDYIDEKKPDSGFQNISIFVENLGMTFGFGGENVLRYKRDGEVLVGNAENVKTSKIEDVDLVNRYWADFETLLKFQKSTLELIRIHTVPYTKHEPLEKLVEVFKSRLRPLSVILIFLETKGGQEGWIAEILKLTNLKILSIANVEREVDDETFRISQISKCENWKNLEEVNIGGFAVVDEDLKIFGHFSKVYLTFREIRVKDVVELKQILQSSSNLDHFHLQYFYLDDGDALSSALGAHLMHNTQQHSKYCYFKTENPEKVLAFSHSYVKKVINFYLMDKFMLDGGDDVEVNT